MTRYFSRGCQSTMQNILSAVVSVAKQFYAIRNVLIVFGAPLLLLPLVVVVDGPVARCAYVIAIMALFWITEALPIPVTSLIPIFLLPMLGLMPARVVSETYLNDTSMLFVGGLIFACAIEKWNIHTRIALLVLMLVGSTPRWLMLGLMLVTWFMSMWISNTATTAMMLPIVQAVLQQLKASTEQSSDQQPSTDVELEEVGTPELERKIANGKLHHLSDMELIAPDPDTAADPSQSSHISESTPEEDPKMAASFKRLSVGMCLAVAYSANIGGIGCLTGTGPNLVLKGQADIVFNRFNISSPISFASWMVYGLPLSFIVLMVLWVWLQIFFLRCNGLCDCLRRRQQEGKEDGVKKVIRQQYRDLGPMKFAEWAIVIIFTSVIVLWITREFDQFCGWGCLFNSSLVSDSTPSTLMCVLLFVVPSKVPRVFCCFRRHQEEGVEEVQPILDWRTVHEKMPWSLYLLLGGGFAIARAAQDTGLSAWVGSKLEVFSSLDHWVMLLILCYIIAMLTEVTSNTAIATLMMPILSTLALNMKVNPLFFMFPAAIAVSFAFCLPVATPPNAMVFSSGYVRVVDMASAGLMMNLVAVPILILATITWGNAFFHFTTLPPAMAAALNVTSALNATASDVVNATLGVA